MHKMVTTIAKEKAWADTRESREIRARTDAKKAEVVAESEKLWQKSVTATYETSRRRHGVKKKETLPTSR